MIYRLITLLLFLFMLNCESIYNVNNVKPSPLLMGHITTDIVLENIGRPYLIEGYVVVDSPYTLTIKPGVMLEGKYNTKAALIISRGAKINAEGTRNAPIVFTSSRPKGMRASRDWGGLIINGMAPINNGDTYGVRMGEGETGYYGGNDTADNSGTLRFVRVEFAGFEYNKEKQLNGIAFQGVGNKTIVEYVQVHKSGDDGIEFFGGTVNAKYILCTGSNDDSFDWTDGWQGKGQFWIAAQLTENSDNCIEADNQEGNITVSPVSHPTLYNVSFIGEEEYPNPKGIKLRRGSRISLHNFIIDAFSVGFTIEPSEWQYFVDTLSILSHGVIKSEINFSKDDGTISSFLIDSKNFLITLDDNFSFFVKPAQWDFRISNFFKEKSFTVKYPPIDDLFFERVDFIGAMGPYPENDWTQGWITTSNN